MNPNGLQQNSGFGLSGDARLDPSSLGYRPDLLSPYNKCALGLVLALTYLNIPFYVNALSDSLPPKYFYYGFALLLFPLLLKSKSSAPYLSSPIALWAFAVALVNGIHLLDALIDGDPGRVDVIGTRIQFILLTVALGVAYSKVQPGCYERIFAWLAVLIPSLVVLDFLIPGLIYSLDTPGAVPGRSAATLINPTTAGEVMLLVFLMACPVVTLRYRMALLMWAGLGIALTFSRSSIIAWLLLWAFLAWNRMLPKSATFLLLAVVSTVPVVLIGFETYLSNRPEFGASMADLQTRLGFFASGSLDDASAVERSNVLKLGWHLFLNNPLVGAGAGSTNMWAPQVGPHNQFVLMAAEYGMVGIAVWVSLAVILWKGRYFENRSLQLSVFFFFVYMSMFTHNMFDFLFWLITFSLVSVRRNLRV